MKRREHLYNTSQTVN